MSAALSDSSAIDALHPQMKANDWSLLQPFRFADTDAAHVDVLLAAADFPLGARVLDVGCGVGECARLMKLARPDLEFVLVNFSQAQLDDCPEGFEQHNASAHNLPFSEASFDAVMFNAALGNMDCMVALAEASRVLKPGGVLFLNELSRFDGDNANLEAILNFRAYDAQQLNAFAEAMGLQYDRGGVPEKTAPYLSRWMALDQYQKAMDGVLPYLWRFIKGEATPLAACHGAIFARHARVALQVSGGKDSLAVLEAMRPWWDRLCVYWLNPGDPFPETVKLMADIKEQVPHFVEVDGHQAAIIAADGWPSDVVPQAYTSDGNFVFGPTPFKVQTRLSCCYRSLMLPMHERMVADGVTCVIRGKRQEEKDKTETRTGSVAEGIEFVYPLWHWTENDVLCFLDGAGIDLPDSYDYASHSLDCMSCSAWWGEGLSGFLAARYPDHHAAYVRKITLIKQAVSDQMGDCEV